MNTLTQSIAEIQVPAEAFKRFKEAKAKASALTKEAEAIRLECGLPDTENLVKQLGLTKANPKGEVVIKDGNMSVIGKIAVYWQDAYEVGAGFKSRVS